jgi:hypothetical protein
MSTGTDPLTVSAGARVAAATVIGLTLALIVLAALNPPL